MDGQPHEYEQRSVEEGKVEVTRTPPCEECGSAHLLGLLARDDGASNVHNILRRLELLNGRRVRVTIEWD